MGYGEIRKRNQEASAGADDEYQKLMCKAHGCPLRWSVMVEGPACSYHAWEQPEKWPAITDRLRHEGPWNLRSDPLPYSPVHSKDKDAKAWARWLKELDEQGYKVSHIQRDMYRSALRIAAPVEEQ